MYTLSIKIDTDYANRPPVHEIIVRHAQIIDDIISFRRIE